MADRTQPTQPLSEAGQAHLAQLVNSFISMMNDGDIETLDLEYGELKLSLRAHRSAHGGHRLPSTDGHEAGSESSVSSLSGAHTITAPMIGTFYVGSAPEERPFVSPGDVIERGQTIGIIEAMKIMNEIAADCDGEVMEVAAEDGQTVEYGSPLVVMKPAAS